MACYPDIASVGGLFGRDSLPVSVRVNILTLTCPVRPGFLRFIMSATKCRWCWRKDLSEFRGLTDRERTGFLLVLEWFENFRLRHELPAGREAAKALISLMNDD